MNFSDTLTPDALMLDADALLNHYFDPELNPQTVYRPMHDLPDLAYDFSECDADDCDDAQHITRLDLDFRSIILTDIAICMLADHLGDEIYDT